MIILSSVFNVLNNIIIQKLKISAEIGELDPQSPTFIKIIFNSNRDFPSPSSRRHHTKLRFSPAEILKV